MKNKPAKRPTKARTWKAWAVVDAIDTTLRPWFAIHGGYLYQIASNKPKCSSPNSRVIHVEIRELPRRGKGAKS